MSGKFVENHVYYKRNLIRLLCQYLSTATNMKKKIVLNTFFFIYSINTQPWKNPLPDMRSIIYYNIWV